jgi:hypothetical protein
VRLQASYRREREEKRRSPATRALCLLLTEVTVRMTPYIPEWHRNPFTFRAFRLALGGLLEALEPPGDIAYPQEYKSFSDALRAGGQEYGALVARAGAAGADRFDESHKTPDALAGYILRNLIDDLLRPHPFWETTVKGHRDHPEHGEAARMVLDEIYDLARARRDLGLAV